jgi:hypothetical protein
LVFARFAPPKAKVCFAARKFHKAIEPEDREEREARDIMPPVLLGLSVSLRVRGSGSGDGVEWKGGVLFAAAGAFLNWAGFSWK